MVRADGNISDSNSSELLYKGRHICTDPFSTDQWQRSNRGVVVQFEICWAARMAA